MVIQQQALWSSATKTQTAAATSPTSANEKQSNSELQLQQRLVDNDSPELCANERIFIKTEPTELTPLRGVQVEDENEDADEDEDEQEALTDRHKQSM